MRSVLNKKIIRDMKKSLGAYLVCILVVVIGILGFCSIAIARDNLFRGKDDFYTRTNFAEGFAQVVKAPAYLETTLADLPGVSQVSGRIVKTAHIVSYPDEEVEMTLVSLSESEINKPEIIKGALPEKGKYEILIGQSFYEARQLKTGDKLEFAINGIKQQLTANGYGQSPEYVYIMKNAQDLIPDPNVYGVGYVTRDLMESVYNFEGYVNDFVFIMAEGVEFSTIEDEVRDILEPYGVIAVYDRSQQISNSMLQGELDQLDNMVGAIPVLFLSVASVIIYIMLKRLVQQQRGQIGVLMGFGFSKHAILRHYVSYGVVIGLIGGFIGGILGSVLGSFFMELYKTFFQIPGLSSMFSIKYFFISIIISVVFCAFAAWRAAHGVMNLQPAESLRPEAPKETRKSAFEKIPFVMSLFTNQGKMSIRNLFRNRRRSLLTLIVVSFAFTIMATLLSMNGLIDTFIFDNLRLVQKQDIRISFEQPVKIEDALRAAELGDVALAEPMLEVGVNIRSISDNKDTSIIALPDNPQLYQLLNEENERVELPNDGIILAVHLAKTLNVGIGDMIELEIGYPEKTISRVKVVDLIPQYFGGNAYMSMKALSKVSDYHNVATAVNIKGGGTALNDIVTRLEDSGIVANVEDREKTIQRYMEFIGSYASMVFIMALMGITIGFSVIYTSSIISFEETKRDIAVLRILGMKSKETLEVISVEKWLITIAGIILGIPMTILVSKWMSTMTSSDVYTFPDFVTVSSIWQSVVCILLAVFISNLVISRKVKEVVPADILKDRE